VRKHLLIDVPLTAASVSLAVGLQMNAPLVAGAAVALALHSWATFNPRSSLYLPVHWRLPRYETACALTFDDGPHPEHTPAILDVLARNSQHATFFVIGEHARKHPGLLRRVLDGGHALGLHSHTHSRWFNCWTPRKVRLDLSACADAVAQATGRPAPSLFRPPVGLKNPLVADVVHDLGLTAVTWTHRTWDAARTDPDKIARALSDGARPGAIVLMHDGHEPNRPNARGATVEALSRVLPMLTQRGLRSHALRVLERGIGLDKKEPV
jgi:peptidoglycan/xylan/chitin deacetylase (PgdA/CDA1 family)